MSHYTKSSTGYSYTADEIYSRRNMVLRDLHMDAALIVGGGKNSVSTKAAEDRRSKYASFLIHSGSDLQSCSQPKWDYIPGGTHRKNICFFNPYLCRLNFDPFIPAWKMLRQSRKSFNYFLHFFKTPSAKIGVPYPKNGLPQVIRNVFPTR